MRAGELHVDALVEGGVDLTGEFPQPGRVRIGEVDEGRTLQRGGRGQVDVVADQDGRARSPGRVQPTAPVGEHDGPRARCAVDRSPNVRVGVN